MSWLKNGNCVIISEEYPWCVWVSCDVLDIHNTSNSSCGRFKFVFQVCHVTMLSIVKILYQWWWTNECVWSIGGMILTGQNQNTQRETWPSTTLSTTNSIWAGLESNHDYGMTVCLLLHHKSTREETNWLLNFSADSESWKFDLLWYKCMQKKKLLNYCEVQFPKNEG
jgi:hypothetical protein